MFAVKIERRAHDQCMTWCTGKWQVCCLVSQDIGLMMKGQLLTATLVSQKKLEGDKRVRVTRVGSLLLPSDPLSSTLTEAICVQRTDTAWINFLQDKNSYAVVVSIFISKHFLHRMPKFSASVKNSRAKPVHCLEIIPIWLLPSAEVT